MTATQRDLDGRRVTLCESGWASGQGTGTQPVLETRDYILSDPGDNQGSSPADAVRLAPRVAAVWLPTEDGRRRRAAQDRLAEA